MNDAFESPFLDRELFVRRSEASSGVDAYAFAAESPFVDKWVPASDVTNAAMESEDEASKDCTDSGVGIIGDDDRRPVKDPLEIPCRWICKLWIRQEDSDGRITDSGATGVLISPRHVLTVAHAIRSAKKNDRNQWVTYEAKQIRVMPARKGDDRPLGTYDVKLPAKVAPLWNAKGKPAAFDYALLTLEKAVGDLEFKRLGGAKLCYWGSRSCGGKSVMRRLPPDWLEGKTAITAGYPKDKGGGEAPYITTGTLSNVTARSRTMNISADTCRGQSGSPVWVNAGGEHCMVGMMVLAGQQTNVALRITDEVCAQLRQWMQGASDACAPRTVVKPTPEAEHSEPDDLVRESEEELVEGELICDSELVVDESLDQQLEFDEDAQATEADAADDELRSAFLDEAHAESQGQDYEQAPKRGVGKRTLVTDSRHGFGWLIETPTASSEAESDPDAHEHEILGNDERLVVSDTSVVPFRFICCLDLLFVHPTNANLELRLRGSGVLIGDRHVLTAAHNVSQDMRRFGFPTGHTMARQIFAAPGRNGRALRFGRSDATTMRVPTQWTNSTNAGFDFALLTLRDRLGARQHPSLGGKALGYWGHPQLGGGTRIQPLAETVLANRTINLSGYPSDKCLNRPAGRPLNATEAAACTGHVPGAPELLDQGSMQWRSLGRVLDPAPRTDPGSMSYDLDSGVGHSGCPVWLRWEAFRNLVAINTGGMPRATQPFDIVANMGVRITDGVLRQLREWMRLDRVSATF